MLDASHHNFPRNPHSSLKGHAFSYKALSPGIDDSRSKNVVSGQLPRNHQGTRFHFSMHLAPIWRTPRFASPGRALRSSRDRARLDPDTWMNQASPQLVYRHKSPSKARVPVKGFLPWALSESPVEQRASPQSRGNSENLSGQAHSCWTDAFIRSWLELHGFNCRAASKQSMTKVFDIMEALE